MCCPGEQLCEAQFLYSRQRCCCLSSSLGASSPGKAAGSPPDSHCVTFVLSSTKVTPKVLVHPVTQTQFPMPELSTTLLQNRNACCVSISYHTSSARAPSCHQGKPKPVGSPGEESCLQSRSSQQVQSGDTCSSPPRPGGSGALVWVAAACTAASLQFVLVAEDGEPLSQQLYW